MGASVYWGRPLRLESPEDDGGPSRLTGDAVHCENMAWASIDEVMQIAERSLGISPDAWPFYPNVELEQLRHPLEFIHQIMPKQAESVA